MTLEQKIRLRRKALWFVYFLLKPRTLCCVYMLIGFFKPGLHAPQNLAELFQWMKDLTLWPTAVYVFVARPLERFFLNRWYQTNIVEKLGGG